VSPLDAEIAALKATPVYDATGAVIDPDRAAKIDALELKKAKISKQLAELEKNKEARIEKKRAEIKAKLEKIGGIDEDKVKALQAKIDSSSGKDKDEAVKALQKYKGEQEQKRKDADSGKDRVIRYAEDLDVSNRIRNMPIIGIGSARKEARAKLLDKLKKKDETVYELVEKALKKNKEIIEKPAEEPAEPSA
jgi:hypothetical protein